MPSRILIADDHSIVREALRAGLETHPDWQVCAQAANGLEAVQKTAELKPDVVILDLSMPEMDGLQAAHEILSASPDALIVIYTACAFSREAKLEARKRGIREVIDKGGSPDALMNAVEALLGPKTRGAAAATAAGANLEAEPRRRPGQA